MLLNIKHSINILSICMLNNQLLPQIEYHEEYFYNKNRILSTVKVD